jgi:hypothetical protein
MENEELQTLLSRALLTTQFSNLNSELYSELSW